MKVRKLNVKRLGIFIGVVLIIFLGIIAGIKNYMDDKKMRATYEYKFSEKGYTTEEISYLKEQLSNSELDFLLEKEYNREYLKLISNEYFEFSKFDEYINYISTNNVTDLDKAISIVNIGANNDWYDEIKETDISKGSLMLVNKIYGLSSDYVPELVLVSSTYAYAGKYISLSIYDDLVSMLDAARGAGFTLVVTQGYRSYDEQEETYNSYKSAHSTREADKFVARPGHSEYQSGLSLDIEPYNKKVEDVTNSAEHKWLLNNAYKYGFILRYEENKEDLTGFDYNPWRFRYVGKEAARQIKENNLTFDEYYVYYVD